MKRKWTKILLTALLCLIAILSVSCQRAADSGQQFSGSEESPEAETNEEGIFGEQYDLGIRLLLEGNYEEAVIAFTVALEIDPKSVAVYTALADAYEAMGDDESLRRILEQGIEATGDVGLKERLAKLPPVLPEQLLLGQYVTVDEELESVFADAIDAGLAGNREVLEDAAWSAALAERVEAYLKERERREERNDLFYDTGGCHIWTQLSNGAILSYAWNGELDYWIKIGYRPENGNGFYCQLFEDSYRDYSYDLTRGETSSWLFNGSFTVLDYSIYYDLDEEKISFIVIEECTGTVADDLLDGESVKMQYFLDENGAYERSYTIYGNFKAGKRQASWTDENGAECNRMIVDDAGEVTYESMPAVTDIWDIPWAYSL